jgi:hypothetical protein
MSLDTKVIIKHHHRNKKKTHRKPLHCCCFFFFFFYFFFFAATFFYIIFFRGTSKLNSKTIMLLMSNLPHTLSLSPSRKYNLLEHKQKVYSANKVYITTSSGVCQAQTQIQAQCVLGISHKCGVLRLQHNIYSDSSTKGFGMHELIYYFF